LAQQDDADLADAAIRLFFAFAVPAFDRAADVALVTTPMGPEGSFDARQDSPIADAPHDCAANLSKRLGYGTAKAVE